MVGGEVVKFRTLVPTTRRRPQPRPARAVEYAREDWERIADHLWRASHELGLAAALLNACRRDKPR